MDINVRELAWAAGLFEGEGCITKTGTHYPTLSLVMTDEDAVRRFYEAVAEGTIHFRPKAKEHYKDSWAWRCSGFANVQAVLCMLWFGLGTRRRNRAIEVMSSFLASRKNASRIPTGTIPLIAIDWALDD